MVRTTGGIGRHRQSWHTVICPGCGTDVQVRRTIPGKPLHIHAHFDHDGHLCPCTELLEEDHLP